jgi:hypothetical protein
MATRRVRGRRDVDPLIWESEPFARGLEQADTWTIAGGWRILGRDGDERGQEIAHRVSVRVDGIAQRSYGIASDARKETVRRRRGSRNHRQAAADALSYADRIHKLPPEGLR